MSAVLPYFIDERPSDGFSLVVPLPGGWRFQLTAILSGSASRDVIGWRDFFASANLELRAFTWSDDA